MSIETLEQLAALIKKRRLEAQPEHSYVAHLNHKGLDKILGKLAEETMEVGLAAKEYEISQSASNHRHCVNELADLAFHLLVLLDHLDIKYQDVLEALAGRSHQSGLEEKRQRQVQNKLKR